MEGATYWFLHFIFQFLVLARRQTCVKIDEDADISGGNELNEYEKV